MLIFLHETLFENVITVLPITYQNKTKMPGNIGSVRFIYENWQVISAIYQLPQYDVWWNR